MCIHRLVYVERNGFAKTLKEMLAQEGYAMSRAGCKEPVLESEDLEFTRDVLAPHLGQRDMPTFIAVLFGDPAAKQLGYSPLGLSSRAGFALALSDAKAGKLTIPA